MSRRLVALALLLLMLCSLTLSATNANAVVATEYDSELLKAGIRFIPPQGWERISSSDLMVVFILRGRAKMAVSLPMRSNPVSFQLSLATWRAANKPISEDKITFSDVPCHVFLSRVVHKEGIPLKQKDYHFLKDGFMYRLVYAAPIEDFERYLPDFEKALMTFELVR